MDMTVFVKIDKPTAAHAVVAELRQNIAQAKQTLARIKAIAELESSKVEVWKANLSSVHSRLDEVEDILLEPQGI